MNFNVDFHYHFDTDELKYNSKPISEAYQFYALYDKLWNKHPDLTLLAII